MITSYLPHKDYCCDSPHPLHSPQSGKPDNSIFRVPKSFFSDPWPGTHLNGHSGADSPWSKGGYFWISEHGISWVFLSLGSQEGKTIGDINSLDIQICICNSQKIVTWRLPAAILMASSSLSIIKQGSTPTPWARGLRDQIPKWSLQTQITLYF